MDLERMLAHLDAIVVTKTIIQLFIIVYAVLWVWSRIVGTQAERLVKGVIILSVIFLASYFAGFSIITSLLQHLIPVAAMAMVVVFQPEIRRGLGYLGRVKTLRTDLSLADSEQEKLKRDIEQIIAAVKELSRSKTGALIVIEPPEGERDYVSPGTPVNANISMNLLLTIFFHKSPLHDGAVVIRNDKIVAAGVILPMTSNPKLSYRYGTRHRAAIGLSEIYDGLCIVVSEETGSISAASRGMLVRYQNADELADPIEYLYHTPEQGSKSITPWQSFLNMFKKGGDASGESTQDLTEIHHFTDSHQVVPDSAVSGAAKALAGEKEVLDKVHEPTKREHKEEPLNEPISEPIVQDIPLPRKGASEIDTLPPANEIKKGTALSGKERRQPKPERRTNDLPSLEPRSLEEPEGVH